VNSGFRTNVDFLFGNHMLLRSSNRLSLELADCFCLDLPKEGIKTEAGGGPTKALVVLMNQGKTNQHGWVEYGSCLRHRDPEACLVGHLAFWFFFRWQTDKTPLSRSRISAGQSVGTRQRSCAGARQIIQGGCHTQRPTSGP
jgi:hypothetical protein